MADEHGPASGPESETLTEDDGATTGFAAGLVVGALLGASIALMLAPDRGDRTRRAVRRKLRELRNEAAEGLGQAGRITRKDVLRRRRRLRAQVERALDRL